MAAIGGTIYVAGGYEGPAFGTIIATLEAYDTVANSWTTKASMPVPTLGAAGTAIGGTMYVVGGFQWSTFTSYSATVWAFDTATGTWSQKADMPTPRSLLASAGVNGMVYAIGGDNGLDVNCVEAYDPSVDSWTTKAPMPTARNAETAIVVGKRILVVGGCCPGQATVEAYDTESNTWTAVASLPAPLGDAGGAAAGGLAYIAGGEYPPSPSPTFHSEVYAYNPFTDTWSTKAPMPRARDELGLVVIGSTIYAIGGGLGCDGCTAYAETDAGCLPPGVVSCSVAASPSAQHVGQWFTVTLTVNNPGDFVLAELEPALGITGGESIVQSISGPIPSGTPYLPPGWSQAFTWTFSASGIGTASFSATLLAYDLASCATITASSAASVILNPRIEPPPNPLLLSTPGAALDRNVFSPSHGDIVLARIAPRNAGLVSVRIYTASGRLIRTLRNTMALTEGQWLMSWDGKTEDEKPVSRGIYVVRITGGGLDERLKVIVR